MAAVLEANAQLRPAPGAAEGGVFRPGDLAVLTLSAVVDEGEVAWPDRESFASALGSSAAVLDDGTDVDPSPLVAAQGHAAARAWTVQLLLAPGQRELPAIPVRVAGSAGEAVAFGDTPPVPVTIGSVLEADVAGQLDAQAQAEDPTALRQAVAQQLAPARGPWVLRSQVPIGWILALLAALALAALLFAWWRRRRARPKPARPVPLEAPEVVARRRLAALRTSGLLARGEHLAFHVELAEILKEYLERRTGVDLRERTTDEIRRVMQPPRLRGATPPPLRDPASRAEVVRVLEEADLVKFARVAPPPSDGFALADAVERIVDRTTVVPADAEGSAAAAPERGAA